MLHTENCVNYICVGLVSLSSEPGSCGQTRAYTAHTHSSLTLGMCLKFPEIQFNATNMNTTESSIRQSVMCNVELHGK